MNKLSKYVGLDVHQETIAVAVADTAGEVRYMGEIVNTPGGHHEAGRTAQAEHGTAGVLLRSRPVRLHNLSATA